MAGVCHFPAFDETDYAARGTGVFQNFDGGSNIHGGNCITSNPHLAALVLDFVKRARPGNG